MKLRNRRIVLASGLVAVVAVAVAAFAVVSRTAAGARQYTTRSVLAQVRAGFDDNVILSSRIDTPPPGYAAAPHLGEVGPRWAYITVAVSDAQTGMVVPYAEAAMLAGAYREDAHAHGMPDVLGFSVQGQLPDGSTIPAYSSVIATPFGLDANASTQSIAQQVAANTRAVPGLARKAVGFVTPHGAAGVVTLIASDPSKVLKWAYPMGLETRVFGADTSRSEGAAVILRDQSGRLIAASASSTRTGFGVGYVAPGQQPDIP